MSIQSASIGGGSGLDFSVLQQRRKPPDLSKDQLVELQQKLKDSGQDTTNLDKIISNFDQLDTDKSGKVSFAEIKAGAQQFGIQVPKGHRHHHKDKTEGTQNAPATQTSQATQQPFVGGPPPGLLSNDPDGDGDNHANSGQNASTNSTPGSGSSYLEKLLSAFSSSNPESTEQPDSSSVNVAA